MFAEIKQYDKLNKYNNTTSSSSDIGEVSNDDCVSEKIVTGKSDFKSFANKPANESSDLEKWHSSGNTIIIPSNKELSVSPNLSSPNRYRTLIMDQVSNFSEEYQI